MLFELVDRNLREAMKFFSRANEGGEVRHMPGIVLISSGINYGVFNSALITEPVYDAAGFEQRLLAARVFFDARGVRWSFWACDDLLESGVRRKAKAICARYRLRLLTEPPGMFAERLRPPKRPGPEMAIRAVANAETRAAFCNVASATFELPMEVASQVYTEPRAWESSFHGYVAYVGGLAVATAASVVDSGIAGIYSVGTLPEFRGRGIASALVRRALLDARELFGVEATVLQATKGGFHLYQELGYRTVTRFSVYLSDAA
jgi:ribosomal protein S18 acetylase RimI-like enzyme